MGLFRDSPPIPPGCKALFPVRSGHSLAQNCFDAIFCSHLSRRWGSQQVHQGDESRVRQAIRCVQAQGRTEVASLQEQLERAWSGEISR